VTLYRQFVRTGGLCFDVGANIGDKSEAFLRLGARVVAVEPNPECVRELRARFGHRTEFQCVNQAIGAEPGHAVLHIAGSVVQSSLRADWGGDWVAQTEVEVTTLDHLIGRFGAPDFCKIDVEGLELEVLRGLSRPVPALSFEYHAIEAELERTRACLDLLGRLGPMRLNLIPMDSSGLLSESGWDEESFRRVFFEELVRRSELFYGDIVVTFASRKS
jgi:FkbM family methyltransferase